MNTKKLIQYDKFDFTVAIIENGLITMEDESILIEVVKNSEICSGKNYEKAEDQLRDEYEQRCDYNTFMEYIYRGPKGRINYNA